MKAAILAIGSELLQGFLVDTNSSFLAQELTALGIEVDSIHAVGDRQESIVRWMRRAMDDADVIVCTGGIGPTADDLTREAVAEICGETPIVDPDLLATVESFFLRRGASMPERNAKQAWLIPSAEALPNAMGTAPGWLVRTGGRVIILMPGVPREMMPMWQQEAVPRLLPSLGGDAIVSRTLKTIGIGESAVEAEIRHLVDRAMPVVSTYAKNDGVHIRVLAVGASHADATSAVDGVVDEITAILGPAIYGELDVSLPSAVLQPLADADKSLSVVEIGTAGQVDALLTSDPVISHVVVEGRALPSRSNGPARRPEALADLVMAVCTYSGSDVGLGVEVVKTASDTMGRHDATIHTVVIENNQVHECRHSFAAREIELGRRASLLAAEDLRRVLLASTPHQTA